MWKYPLAMGCQGHYNYDHLFTASCHIRHLMARLVLPYNVGTPIKSISLWIFTYELPSAVYALKLSWNSVMLC